MRHHGQGNVEVKPITETPQALREEPLTQNEVSATEKLKLKSGFRLNTRGATCNVHHSNSALKHFFLSIPLLLQSRNRDPSWWREGLNPRKA